MTLYHFNLLNENEQAQIIREKGVLVGERQKRNHTILLYQIDAFYVEAYHHNHFNVITKFRSFHNGRQLEPYLKVIEIDDLIEG